MLKKRILFSMLFALQAFVNCWRVDAESIELVTSMDYPPYVSNEVPDGGIATAIVRESFAVSGHDITLRLMPWKRAYRIVQEGTYSGTFVWSHSRQRTQDFLLSVPIFANANVIFTTLVDIKVWNDIKVRAEQGLKTIMCAPLGWKVGEALVALKKEGALTFVEPEKVDSCLNLMMVGRVHMVSVPRMNFLFSKEKAIKALGRTIEALPTIYEIAGPMSEKSTEHVMFSKNAEGQRLKILFDQGFQVIVANGAYKRILKKHLSVYSVEEQQAVQRDLRLAGLPSY